MSFQKYSSIFCFAFCIAGIIVSCTKVVPLNLRTAPPMTVIEANITDGPGPYTVRITKTTSFYDSNSYTGLAGATVTIRDGAGNASVLTDEGGGNYLTSGLQGESGETYYLRVELGKDTFTAVSTMPSLVPLDSVYYKTVKNGGKDVIVAVPALRNPDGPGIAYYFFNQTINGYLDKSLYYAESTYSEGLVNTFPLERNSADSTLHVGDTVAVEMQCIDSAMYGYWKSMDIAATGSGAAYPGNPVTNISGGALGYFSAHTTRIKGVRVR